MSFEFKGEILGLITAICWSFGMIYLTEAAKRLGANALNHFRLLLASILLGIAVLLFDRISLSQLFLIPSLKSWLWLGLSGFIGLTLGDWFAFRALQLIGPRKTSLFYTFAPGAALIFGIIFLKETISLVAFVGMVITVSGVFWVIFNRKSKEEHHDPKLHALGVLFAIGAALTQGIGLVFSKVGILEDNPLAFSPLHATWVRIFIAMISLFSISIFSNKALSIIKPMLKADKPAIAYASVASVISPVLGATLSLYTAMWLNVSIAQTLFSMVPVFILPVLYIHYREKITLQAFLGALIAVGGVLILVWRNEIGAWF